MNNVCLKGRVINTPEFYYEAYGEKFYKTYLAIKRKNETEDIIVLQLPECLTADLVQDIFVQIQGNIRTNRYNENGKLRTLVQVFVQSINIIGQEYYNEVHLIGRIIKVTPRKTLKGLDICDVCLAVERNYKVFDYIPVITWRDQAKIVSTGNIHTNIEIKGRLQSREYTKVDKDGNEIETRTVLEVSTKELTIKGKE